MSNALTLTPVQKTWLQSHSIGESEFLALANSVFPGAKVESIVLAVHYCRARKLDPMKKPVHIVPMMVKDAKTGQSSWRDVIMPGVSELLTTAARTGEFAGVSEPEFGPLIEYKGVTAPEWCKVTVWRIMAGQRCPFTYTEYFAEAVATTKDGKVNAMWTKRPRGQLAKCARAGAIRLGFPEEIGGMYSAEEMEGKAVGAGSFIDVGSPEKTTLEDLNSSLGLSEPAQPDPELDYSEEIGYADEIEAGNGIG